MRVVKAKVSDPHSDAPQLAPALFRSLVDSIPRLAWMTDGEGYIFWYNQQWFDYTGTTLSETQGWGWRAVHHPDDTERINHEVKGHWARGVPSR